jgi:hypothetical protein
LSCASSFSTGCQVDLAPESHVAKPVAKALLAAKYNALVAKNNDVFFMETPNKDESP